MEQQKDEKQERLRGLEAAWQAHMGGHSRLDQGQVKELKRQMAEIKEEIRKATLTS